MAKRRDKGWYDAGLARLDAMIAAGEAEAALALAASLAAEAEGDPADPMGPLTLAGLPRRLHAAQLRLARAEGDQVAKLGWQAMQGPELGALLPLAQLTPEERAQAVALAGAPASATACARSSGVSCARGSSAPSSGPCIACQPSFAT